MVDQIQQKSTADRSINDIDTILEVLISEKKQTILVVDDMEIEIDVLLSILSIDYTVRVATDGKSALASIDKDIPDMILLDVLMPGMNGFEICRQLKANHKTSNIPVIFITSLNEAFDETRGLELGAVDYIYKPFIPAIVKLRIQNQLELKKYREHLETIVALRTRELLQANNHLKKLDNARIDYLRAISQELRTPFQGMINFADMSQYFALSYKVRDRLLNTIDNALHLAEFDDHHNNTNLVNLSEIIGITISFLNESISIRDLTVNFQPIHTIQVYGNAQIIDTIIQTSLQIALIMANPCSNVDLVLHNNMNVVSLLIRFECGPIPEDLLQTFFDIFSFPRSKSRVAEIGLAVPLAADQIHSLGGNISIRNISHGAELELIFMS